MDENLTIRQMAKDEFDPLFQNHVHEAFAGDHSYALADALTPKELDTLDVLDQRLGDRIELRLGVFGQDDRFVGWSWGRQENKSTFYMINSAVLPEFRRRGVYSALIQAVVAEAEAYGFQLIYSRHCATNNAVIIPKLKAGFLISKFELDDTHGVLVHLHYYTNETRRKVMSYRSGQVKPDAQVKALFSRSK